MPPAFVIVEDDHLQKGPLEENLRVAFPGAQVTVLSSEHQFREHLPQLIASPPDLVLMDVMLRWTLPAPNAPEPPRDVTEGGYYRAGLRCANLLLADKRCCSVPVVLYTILERSDLERDNQALPVNSSYVGKGSDIEVLLRKIRALLERAGDGHRQPRVSPG
jgi:DNA-binding NarL/FixJ family response regulator